MTSLHPFREQQASPKPEEPPEKKQRTTKQQQKQDASSLAVGAAAEANDLPVQEVFRRLRALEQPITLFGEVGGLRSCIRACS